VCQETAPLGDATRFPSVPFEEEWASRHSTWFVIDYDRLLSDGVGGVTDKACAPCSPMNERSPSGRRRHARSGGRPCCLLFVDLRQRRTCKRAVKTRKTEHPGQARDSADRTPPLSAAAWDGNRNPLSKAARGHFILLGSLIDAHTVRMTRRSGLVCR